MLVGSAGGWNDPLSAVLLTGTYALATRLSVQLGPGLVGPTQLVFVPMLFLAPAEAVPALVAAGLVLSVLPEIVLRRAHPERALVAVADSWFAVGPAAVFALLSPGEPGWGDLDVYLLALAAQFALDFAVSTLREWLGAGIPPRELRPVLAIVYLVDALLSPIGFLAVLASTAHHYAYLLAVPSGALLALLAGDRRRRVGRELELARAYRRSTRLLNTQAEDLRRAYLRVGEAVATMDRRALERVLLATTVEAVGADCGRLSSRTDDEPLAERLVTGEWERCVDALRAAEAALLAVRAPQEMTVGDATALAIPLGSRGDVLTVARAGRPFSAEEAELLEHLAAQAAVSLENLHLHEAERAAAEAIRELSTPVLAVHERLLIVPLVGAVDATRARHLTDELLRRIRAGRARVAVIDVTGVPVIDTAVAGQLVGTIEACRLLGARVVVTGLSSELTQALALSGVDVRAIHAVADLQRGIEEAQRMLDSASRA
jgi:anti-anti-sigma factor